MKTPKSALILMLFLFGFMIGLMGCNEPAPNNTNMRSNDPLSDEEPEEEVEELAPPARPTGVIQINSQDICACKQSESLSYNPSCNSLCAQRSAGVEDTMLYFTATPGAEIELDENYQDFQGWCQAPLIDPETGEAIEGNPECTIEVKDPDGNVSQLSTLTVALNSGKAIINALQPNTIYRLTVKEIQSGAVTNTFQLRLKPDELEPPRQGPLYIEPITQYDCLFRSIAPDEANPNVIYVDYATRLVFYFDEGQRPDPIFDSTLSLFCHHDYQTNNNDSSEYPRLNQTPGAFALWDKDDPFFFDINGNGVTDLDEYILQEVENLGVSLSSELKLFYPFNWYTEPTYSVSTGDGDDSSSGSGAVAKQLGNYMIPFTDSDSLLSYCPNDTHYQSNNPLFEVLGEVIGVETEGIYIAKKVGPDCTFMLIRENDLKEVWFYRNGSGQNVRLTEGSARGKKIQFYYPLNPDSPTVQTSTQSAYTVMSTQELATVSCGSGSSAPTSGQGSTTANNPTTPNNPSTQLQPHDKKIGCIPVAGD